MLPEEHSAMKTVFWFGGAMVAAVEVKKSPEQGGLINGGGVGESGFV